MDTARGQVNIKDTEHPSDPPKSFTFDSVWDDSTQQRDFYIKTARPIVECVLNGYNGTIFAYGQTGTGKTFSMEGVRDSPDLRGIIPNSFDHIFSHIQLAGTNTRFLVRASYLEIYNEEIRDLLNANAGQKLDVKEHPETGVYVKDLTSFVVKNSEEMDKLMAVGNRNRSVGFTEMNARSSRSHSIFTITVEMSEETQDGSASIRMGKLHLVDLAGSERQSKTGATGDRLKEATKINLSLSCLGNVIKALVDGKSSHVPYRDSKLTRLLQDSLGGNAKTMMVATMSPASYNYDETISTLRYASRAKNIKNKPKVNEDPKDAMLREFQEEIQRLRAQLEQVETGVGASSLNLAGHGEGRTARAEEQEEDEEDDDDHEDDDEEEEDVPVDGKTEATVGPASVSDNQSAMPGNAPPQDAPHRTKKQSHQQTNGYTDQQLQDLQAGIEQEKRAILQSQDMIESEKQRILAELSTRSEDLAHEQRQRQELSEKIKQMESKLLVGGVNILDKEAQQREELAMRTAELEEKRLQQVHLQQQLMQEDEQALQMEEEYTSLQEEVSAKTGKIKKLWNVLLSHKQEIADLTAEFQREREDLLDTVRDLSRELKLRMKIVERYVPDEELGWIEASSEWDASSERWRIFNSALAGNNAKAKRNMLHADRRVEKNFRSAGHKDTDYNYFSPALPNSSAFLTYDAQSGSSMALRKISAAAGRSSSVPRSPSKGRSSSSSPNKSAIGTSAGGARNRPQAARVKSSGFTSSARSSPSDNAPTPDPDRAPTARGLVQRGRHYA
ncbi:hypothetical protein RI367_005824 [Sorochytrium milnesiophthora]